MFFDIGWPEFLVIGVVALLVIGPKDLPAALRVAGFWVRKARSLSREFHSSVEQMMREAELHEVQNELRKATEFDLDREFNKIVDPTKDPALATAAPAIPDHFDTTSAPVIDEPPALIEPVAAETLPAALPELQEPELPAMIPAALPEAQAAELHPAPGPAPAAEPSKP